MFAFLKKRKLIAQLKNKDEYVRDKAIEEIVAIGDEEFADPLIAASNDPVFFVRLHAIRALGKIKARKAKDVLTKALEDREDSIRAWANCGLYKLGDSQRLEALISVMQKSLLVSDQDNAVEALGDTGDSKAVEPLIDVLKNGEDRLKASAAHALGSIRDTRAIEPLAYILKWGRTPYVQSAAAKALGNIGSPEAVDALLYVIRGNGPIKQGGTVTWPNGASLVDVAGALMKIGDGKAIEELLNDLNTGDFSVRFQAVCALAVMKEKRAIEPLTRLAKGDPEALVRKEAQSAVERIKKG